MPILSLSFPLLRVNITKCRQVNSHVAISYAHQPNGKPATPTSLSCKKPSPPARRSPTRKKLSNTFLLSWPTIGSTSVTRQVGLAGWSRSALVRGQAAAWQSRSVSVRGQASSTAKPKLLVSRRLRGCGYAVLLRRSLEVMTPTTMSLSPTTPATTLMVTTLR